MPTSQAYISLWHRDMPKLAHCREIMYIYHLSRCAVKLYRPFKLKYRIDTVCLLFQFECQM